MNAMAARLVACLVAALALVGAWFYVQALRGDLAAAQDTARTAQETVDRRDATIAQLQKTEREHARQLAQLERTRQGVAADLAARETELEALKHESETVRAWADGAIPDDVVRLYTSPALTGTADLLSTMRAGNGMHDAGNVAAP
ncbi:LysB family phage lysis regulatory protein [Caballeronia udeis]|uniref:LysB family phage lysis regulatory protein n=1 Tax=Caballeronia udeis TaxID=1232866 RepID=A0A158GAC2_9BURK|nr:Rz-like lysis system protein LysB [Caballeronia udeis]SAL28827.1 protein lysB [Caballeronia udeis]